MRQARTALAAAGSAERNVYLTMQESLQRRLVAAFEGVIAQMKTLWADPEAAAWLRRRLRGEGPGMMTTAGPNNATYREAGNGLQP